MDTIWATEADRFDGIAEAHVAPLLRGAGVGPGSWVVDAGCGTGATTIAAASTTGPEGRVLGIDIDPALLAVARERADRAGLRHVELVEGDVTTRPFARQADAVISRSTVMLFPEPAVGLRNLRRALRPGGRLAATCWQAEPRNGWRAVPARIVARHLGTGGDEPDADHRPGAFALADPARLRAAAVTAGFVEVDVEAIEHGAVVGTDVDDALAFFDLVAGAALRTIAPPHVVAAVEADLREALAEHAGPAGVVVPAAAWLLTGRAP